MPRGLYRDSGGWVQVNYEDKFLSRMHRSDYEDHDYKPRFEALPMKDKYVKARQAPQHRQGAS